MTIDKTVDTALSAVLANAWPVRLPPNPSWPAIEYEIESEPEEGWVMNGGYTQHVIDITLYARTKTELATYLPQIRTAMEAMVGYMSEEESGDAPYEDNPEVYGKFVSFRIRTQD